MPTNNPSKNQLYFIEEVMALVRLGTGMDKSFYYESGDFGWLEFKEAAVRVRELAAYENLKKTAAADNLPAIDVHKAPPPLVHDVVDDAGKKPVQGYWMECVPNDGVFKPKMCIFLIPQKAQTALKALGVEQRKVAVTSLTHIKNNLAPICECAGELSIAINKNTGKAYLLDYAAGSDNKAGGEELATTAGKGLDKILQFIGTLK